MGDGAKKNKGFTLCTDNFTLQEVIMLINIFIIKFNINPPYKNISKMSKTKMIIHNLNIQ